MSAQHGNTPAAWTTVALLIVAFIVGGIGLVAGSMMTFWVGVVLAPVALILGLVVSKMGYGSS